ncbi:MAG: hypothetical protein ACODAQ_03220, partial [Phycisphaeraceae bacterium]
MTGGFAAVSANLKLETWNLKPFPIVALAHHPVNLFLGAVVVYFAGVGCHGLTRRASRASSGARTAYRFADKPWHPSK